MDRLVERCAGLDVHKDTVAATVRVPGGEGQRLQETSTFSTTTRGLLTLADWLESYGVTLVGMESTGCYWKPVFYLLEERFECWLLNPRHLRNVPGRKTDVADSAWICELVEHGSAWLRPWRGRKATHFPPISPITNGADGLPYGVLSSTSSTSSRNA